MQLRALTARKLDDQLAMSLRLEDRASTQRLIAEYKRRGVKVPDKLYRWWLGLSFR